MKKKRLPEIITVLILLFIFLVLFESFLWNARKESIPDLTSEKIIEEIITANGRFDPTEREAIFNNKPVIPPAREIAYKPERVLSAVSPEEKWIEVDLTNQRLYAHEGDWIVYDFPISSGKAWTPTVTGEFRVWIKFKYAKMSGGSRDLGNYYYLPNVPFIMYFHKGYGIHGAYWHNNFGHPMSHGCVNMKISDSETLFYWADPSIEPDQGTARPTPENPGTRVVIRGTTPRS